MLPPAANSKFSKPYAKTYHRSVTKLRYKYPDEKKFFRKLSKACRMSPADYLRYTQELRAVPLTKREEFLYRSILHEGGFAGAVAKFTNSCNNVGGHIALAPCVRQVRHPGLLVLLLGHL